MRKTFALTALALAAFGQAALLHDNGQWITGIGNGFGGANTSQIASGGSLFGSNINTAVPFFSADDFTIIPGHTWTLNSFSFYTYQTQSVNNTTSTITSARVAIFNAAPTNTTQGLISGSLASNGNILSNAWSGVYRVSTDLTNTQRAVMKVTVDLGGVVLGAGTYWIAWGAAGTVNSGPWGVPLSPVKPGSNALRWSSQNSAWEPVIDAGNSSPVDFAFEIEGSAVVPEPASMLALGGALAAFARRRRK
jgi:hypothetical protein